MSHPDVPAASMAAGSGAASERGSMEPLHPYVLQDLLTQYEVLGVLGVGGMGAVYHARHIPLDREVAIKVLPPVSKEENEQLRFVERFKNEARTMARLSHHAIVAVHDFGKTSTGHLFFVMEYVAGTDVQKMLEAGGRLAPLHALAITAHVCDALHYAHTHGVFHRDIKPANILVDREGQVKVADFGLARMSDAEEARLRQTSIVLGTPDFVAPECLMTGVVIDGRADIFATGVMLHLMLTGALPQQGGAPASLCVPGVDWRMDAIIARATHPDRQARYQTAAEFRRDLDGIIAVPFVAPVAAAPMPVAAVVEAPARAAAQAPRAMPPRAPGSCPLAQGRPALRTRPGSPPSRSRRFPMAALIVGLVTVAGLVVMALLRSREPVAGQGAAAPVAGFETPAKSSAAEPRTVPASSPVPKPVKASEKAPIRVVNTPAPKPVPKMPGVEKKPPTTAAASSPPPVVRARVAELEELRGQFEQLKTERVIQPHEAELVRLGVAYKAGLSRALSAAGGQGRSEEAAALQTELSRFKPGENVPPQDAAGTPAALASLRGIFREQVSLLEARQQENLRALVAPLASRLQTLESTLEAQGRGAEAMQVKEFRLSLPQATPNTTVVITAAPVPVAPPSVAPPAAAGTVEVAPMTRYPAGDDRAAASWVIGLGGSVWVTEKGRGYWVRDIAALPKGRFELQEVKLEFTTDGNNDPKGPVENLLPLAGLKALAKIWLRSLPLKDAWLPPLASSETLKLLHVENCGPGITDACFPLVAQMTSLEVLEVMSQPAVTGSGLTSLKKLKSLRSLSLQSSAIGAEQCAGLAELRQIVRLNVSFTAFSDASLPALKGIPGLVDLQARGCPLTAAALARAGYLRELQGLGFDFSPGAVEADANLLAGAFPRLATLAMQGRPGVFSAEDFRSLAHFSRLTRLVTYIRTLDDAAIQGLLDLSGLMELRLNDSQAVYDTSLATLSRHGSLKILGLSNVPVTDTGLGKLADLKSLRTLELNNNLRQISPAAIEMLRKERPDLLVRR